MNHQRTNGWCRNCMSTSFCSGQASLTQSGQCTPVPWQSKGGFGWPESDQEKVGLFHAKTTIAESKYGTWKSPVWKGTYIFQIGFHVSFLQGVFFLNVKKKYYILKVSFLRLVVQLHPKPGNGSPTKTYWKWRKTHFSNQEEGLVVRFRGYIFPVTFFLRLNGRGILNSYHETSIYPLWRLFEHLQVYQEIFWEFPGPKAVPGWCHGDRGVPLVKYLPWKNPTSFQQVIVFFRGAHVEPSKKL